MNKYCNLFQADIQTCLLCWVFRKAILIGGFWCFPLIYIWYRLLGISDDRDKFSRSGAIPLIRSLLYSVTTSSFRPHYSFRPRNFTFETILENYHTNYTIPVHVPWNAQPGHMWVTLVWESRYLLDQRSSNFFGVQTLFRLREQFADPRIWLDLAATRNNVDVVEIYQYHYLIMLIHYPDHNFIGFEIKLKQYYTIQIRQNEVIRRSQF